MNEEYQSRTEKNKNKKQRGSLFRNRKEQSSGPSNSGSTFDKVFYILIAFLFLLLIAVVIFIMNFSDSSTEGVSEDIVQEEGMGSIRDLFADDSDQSDDDNQGDNSNTDQSEDEGEEETTDEDTEETTEDTEDDTEEETDDTNETQGDQSIINENPPHDPSYAIDFADGSSDRIEIRENVLAVTGIPQDDLIENWIGNDGPGRVEATVTQQSTGDQYVVYLQYGDGQWHVESVNPQ